MIVTSIGKVLDTRVYGELFAHLICEGCPEDRTLIPFDFTQSGVCIYYNDLLQEKLEIAML